MRHLGFVPHAKLHEAYQSADVFVFPSLAEGGVYVIYEALAAGLPCIVSANAGSAVRDGIEGFVVPVGDVEALAARLTQLAGDEALRRQAWRLPRAREPSISPGRISIAASGSCIAKPSRAAARLPMAPMDLFER